MLQHIHRRDSGLIGRKRSRGEPTTDGANAESGTGHPKDPFRLALRAVSNGSGCYHCPTAACECQWVNTVLHECYESLRHKRQVLMYHRSDLCAKSVLPPFVSRMVRHAALKEGELFYDFGCGNGSVVFQVALMTGAHCVGIEVNPINAQVAKEAWEKLKPIFEKRCGRELHVEIICADFCDLMKERSMLSKSCVIWLANLLLPDSLNHYLSERLRSVGAGTRIFCFKDLFPHSRTVAAIRDPDAFQRFRMEDFTWQHSSVEWCDLEGTFYLYTRRLP